MSRLRALALLAVAIFAGGGQANVQQRQAITCATAQSAGVADPDLYCIDLLPPLAIDGPAGVARLMPPASPFGIAVSPAGEMLYDVVFGLRDLPAPASLGAYKTFVAWAAAPQMHPLVKLGEVRNGTTRLGRVNLDRFLLIVTAEPSLDVASLGSPGAPTGRVVLRGTSAAMRMQPHDVAFFLAGLLEQKAAAPAGADHAAHQQTPTPGEGSWTQPPMHPDVAMPPAFMSLRPDVAPYRPASDDAPLARPRELLRLRDGASIDLVAAPVRRVLFGRTVTMLGFNGQYPGPLIEVTEASTIVIRFTNRTGFETAVHWHGIRLDNRFDGAPHVTQDPVPPGGSFTYRVFFPDAGIYWYHPHHREDVLQDLGLYGNLLVRSREPDYFAPANREEVLMLDDLLVAESGPVEHGREAPTHALMGRFGNVLLVNGEPRWDAAVARGEVVRLFLTNVSSTRVFNLSFQGAARMKVVASDLSRYEREAWVENVTIAPAERYVVDVRFDTTGDVRLVNRVRAIDHIMARFFDETRELGVVRVSDRPTAPDHAQSFARLRSNASVTSDIAPFRKHFDRPVDRELLVTLRAGDLPFPLRPLMSFESVYRNPVEWTGTMPEMDWVATGKQVRWTLQDRATGRENMEIDWRFKVGDVVKIRLVNDRSSLHAMQHPIHIHGQRFLVLFVNGVSNENLVWKDTVLLPTGFVADVLVDVTNPGKWMLHCHVAEHIETGMRMVFEVNK
jgi:FtsP/CotA-like multicopper oxidase with cupredoxin domain